jgi:hypothetical protein
MLALPAIQQFGDVTVYADTDLDYRFYALPNVPRLRYGPDGKPVFEFLKYRFDPADVPDTPGAPKGGGYIQFDTQLVVPDDVKAKIVAALQSNLDKKYQPSGQKAPPVELAPVWYVGDDKTAVSLITMQPKPDGTGMVTNILGSGKPSLTGDNTASFAMELSQNGAALFWQACQMATLPIAVVYDVKFMAAIPAMRMHVWLYSSQMHQFDQSISKDIDDSVCDSTDETYTNNMREIFSKYNFAGVSVTSTDPGVSPETAQLIKDMTDNGWSLLESTLKDDMKDKFDPTKDADKGEAGDFNNTIRNYLQSYTEQLDLTYSANQTLPFPIHPQGTLQGFLKTPGPNGALPDPKDFFKEVSLDDPFFKMLQVRVHCNADFQNDPIFSVKVHIEYGSTVQDLLFTDSATPQTFKAYRDAALGNKYKYWMEVNYKNSDRVYKTSEVETDETQLVPSVNELGILRVQLAAGSIQWDRTASAEIHITYEDSSNNVAASEDVYMIKPDAPSATWSRQIFAPVVNPYKYKCIFIQKDSQRVETDWIPAQSPLLLIDDLYQDHVAVEFIASSSFDKIDKIVLDMSYQDTDHTYSVDDKFELKAGQDTYSWIVPIFKGATKQFKYRSTVAYKDGHTTQSDWKTVNGSQTVVVGEIFADTLSINCMTDLIDFTAVKLVKVVCTYQDAAHQIDASEDFVFKTDQRTAQPWQLGIMDAAKRQFSYSVTYYMADGTSRAVPATATTDPTIVLQVPALVAAH